jgi:UPF0271 protein
MKRIDLNCDLGESFGAWRMGDDDALLALISSASIACGFHAGDPDIMQSHGGPGHGPRRGDRRACLAA